METGKPSEGEVQIVELWKNGKKYELAIDLLLIFKGWFGDQVSSIYKIEPVPEDAFTILDRNYFSRSMYTDRFKKGVEIRNYQ